MQEQFIDFGVSTLTPPAAAHEPIAEKLDNVKQSVKQWLNSECKPMSRIAEFTVTWRVVLLVNLVTILLLVAAIAVAQAPIATVVCMVITAWLTYRLNHVEKKGGKA